MVAPLQKTFLRMYFGGLTYKLEQIKILSPPFLQVILLDTRNFELSPNRLKTSMSQAQPRPSSPRTGRPSVPWFATRVVSLFLAWCWGIIGAASGRQYFYFLFPLSDFLRN